MGRHRAPKVGQRINLGHPLARGLRFLAFMDSQQVVNLVGPGAGTATDLAYSRDYRGGLVTFNGSSSKLVFDVPSGGYDWSGSVTFLVRCDADGLQDSTLLEGNKDATAGGFAVQFGQSGGNTGFRMTVFDQASHLLQSQTSTGEMVVNRVFGGRFEQPAGRTSVWADGLLIDSDVDLTYTYNDRVSVPLRVGVSRVDTAFYDGTVYWLAGFRRALSAAEMWWWSREDWSFLYEDETFTDTGATFNFTTGVGASGAQGLSDPGGVSYGTVVRLTSAAGGDLLTDPPDSGDGGDGPTVETMALDTGVAVLTPYQPGEPVLVPYHTKVSAGQTLSAPVTVSYETDVNVSQDSRPYIDCRKDLLESSRYRR